MKRTKPIRRDDWGQLLQTKSAGLKIRINTEGFGPVIAGSYSRSVAHPRHDESRIVSGPYNRIKELFPDSEIKPADGFNKWKISE